MLKRKEKQNRKVNFYEAECNVSENVLTEIVKLANSSFYISLGGVCKKSELNDVIMCSGQQFVTSITPNIGYDVVLNITTKFFNEMIPLLFVSETEVPEVVIIDIPFNTTTFVQFLNNRDLGVQGSAIKKELCCLTCTWVTEDNRLFFWFDDFQGAEMFKTIKRYITNTERRRKVTKYMN